MAQSTISQGTLRVMIGSMIWHNGLCQNNWFLMNGRPSKVRLLQSYKVLWIHVIDAISTFSVFSDKPICIEDQTIYGVSEGETAHISCRVDSYPEADAFGWSFNTSSGGMDLSRDSFTNKGSSSLLYYTPKSQMDYGTVLCVAANVVGRQIVPCIYHVIPAGIF